MIAKTIMSATATAHSFTGDTGSATGGVSAGRAATSLGGVSAGAGGRSFGGSEGINAGLRPFDGVSRFDE